VADANVKGSMTGKQTAKLVGAKVATPTGESLGEVKEVVVDTKGNPSYAVISHGAVMGVGGKRTAVPWATVQTAMQDDKLIMDRTQLEQAPVLQGSKTPDASSGTWSRDADTYWRAKVSTRSTSPMTGTSPSTPAPVPAPSKQY